MNEQRFETGPTPRVVVETCDGALSINSWKESAVRAQGVQFSGDAPERDRIILSSADDLALTVPEKANLIVTHVRGALAIKHVDGIINIGTAEDNVTLNNSGSVKIEQINGSLRGENVDGPLNVTAVERNITLRNVNDTAVHQADGAISIHYANGAVTLTGVQGQIELHTINGDVTVGRGEAASLSNLGGRNQVSGIAGRLRLVGGLANGEHSFQAAGDIYVAWPVDAPLTLVAEAIVIDNQLLLANAARTKLEEGQTQLTGHIEQGKPFVSLKTTANIGLKALRPGETVTLSAADFDFSPPPPTLADVVGTAVATTFPDATPVQVQQITVAIESHLAQAKPITPPIPSSGQIAAARAQRKVEKSLQKAEDSIAQAQTKLTRPPASPPPKAAKPETVEPEPVVPETAQPATTALTAPSQTQILQLLKDDLITVEQANLLLDNLRDA